MTWRPQNRPDLVSDGFKVPGDAYKLAVSNTSAFKTIPEDYKCVSMYFPGDLHCYWDIDSTATDADHYAHGGERINIALPKGGSTNIHIRTVTGSATGTVYFTAFKEDT